MSASISKALLSASVLTSAVKANDRANALASAGVCVIEISRAGWLGGTAILARGLSTLQSLARANGWGLAGQCPAFLFAKTPAVRERVCRVAAAGIGVNFARASARAETGGSVV